MKRRAGSGGNERNRIGLADPFCRDGGRRRLLDKENRQQAERFLQEQENSGLRGRPWQITEFFNELLFRLPALRQAQAHAGHGNRVYSYYWDYPSALPHLGACHAVELAYVFNNLHETIYTGKPDYAPLAAATQQMWVNFAKTGDPSLENLPWPPYSETARNTMILGERLRIEQDWRASERKCLTPLLKYRFNGNSAATSIDLSRLWKIAAVAAGVVLTALLLWLLLR